MSHFYPMPSGIYYMQGTKKSPEKTEERKKMSAFDQVIGYESIKEEMMQVCDMIRNPDVYADDVLVMEHGIWRL